MSLLHPSRGAETPHLESLTPRAAIPGGTFEVHGEHFIVHDGAGPRQCIASIGDETVTAVMMRPTRAVLQVPDGVIASDLMLRDHPTQRLSNVLHANIGVPMAEDLHLVSNPCIDPDGNLYAMVSGARGQRVPVSIYRIERDLQMRPFVRDLLNISALAFGPDDHLYASSRAEGTVYRISREGAITTFAEGLGLATGIAFDPAGNLCVGDRSGTIFKISPSGEIFVFATLEPSVAAYHLCFGPAGVLYVTAPGTGSHQSLHAFDPNGEATIFFTGLGRPQGMAFDDADRLYVAASYRGRRGIFRLSLDGAIEHIVSGNDLVGLCFLEDGCVALARKDALFHLDLGINGRPLV